MNALRDLIEKAEAVVRAATHLHVATCPIPAIHINNLESALTAAKAELAGTEDRVREAAKAARVALFNCFNRSPESQEWLVADAIREYVTPAPALPEGTVAVEVSLLKRWRVAMSRCIATNGSPTHNLSLPEIDAILPPPKPDPPNELQEKWEREASAAMSHIDLIRERIMFQQGYVARCRAEWDAAQK